MTRTARWLGCVALLVYVLSGGGRVVGSDEVTMLELSRAMLRGRIDVPAGATLAGPDGRQFSKNLPGQAVLALPLVAGGEVLAATAGLEGGRRELAVRFAASFFNALVTAALLAVFFGVARSLGVRAGPALAASLLLGFTTPLWVYAKSFMAEPLQGLGLLLALGGAVRARQRSGARWIAAAGFLLAAWVKPSMLPLAVLAVTPLLRAGPGGMVFVGACVATALAGIAGYNVARFGNPLESGYGAQGTLAAYTTPLPVGLYGLLLSTGKGVLWFAPALWLVPAGWRSMRRAGGDRAQAANALGFMAAVALLLYGTFQHWAGDGSFGPRYLVPLLPVAFLAVAFGLDGASAARRRWTGVLAVAGLLVQIGGVSIHFGAQMREAGDYPYTRALEDPLFMSESHFHPAYSPIAAHWRLLARNVGAHLRGQAPRLSVTGGADARLGIGAEDQQRLLGALDFWAAYLGYAGYPRVPVFAALALLAAALALAFSRLRGALDDERVAA